MDDSSPNDALDVPPSTENNIDMNNSEPKYSDKMDDEGDLQIPYSPTGEVSGQIDDIEEKPYSPTEEVSGQIDNIEENPFSSTEDVSGQKYDREEKPYSPTEEVSSHIDNIEENPFSSTEDVSGQKDTREEKPYSPTEEVSGQVNDKEEQANTSDLNVDMDTNQKDNDESKKPVKRRMSVITISDTESDDSSVCLVKSYQASSSEAKRLRGAMWDQRKKRVGCGQMDDSSPNDALDVPPSTENNIDMNNSEPKDSDKMDDEGDLQNPYSPTGEVPGQIDDIEEKPYSPTKEVSGQIDNIEENTYSPTGEVSGQIDDIEEKPYSPTEEVSGQINDIEEKPYSPTEEVSGKIDNIEENPFSSMEEVSGQKDDREEKPYSPTEEVSGHIDNIEENPFSSTEDVSGQKDDREENPYSPTEEVSGQIDNIEENPFSSTEDVSGQKDDREEKPYSPTEEVSGHIDNIEENPFSSTEDVSGKKDSREEKPYSPTEEVSGQVNDKEEQANTSDLNVDMDTNQKDYDESKKSVKRRMSVITISDTESDDSSVCLVKSYQASSSEAKRLRGDYSSSDSYSESSEYDSEPDGENATLVVSNAPSLLSQCSVALKTRAPRLSDPKFNRCFVSEEIEQKFLHHWSRCEDFTSENLTLHSQPFRLCVLDNFVENADIVNNIIDDMTTLDWSRRKMDLYEFHRSKDLVSLSWQRAIKSFYDLLKDEVMKWVEKITNLKLTHVSASCALYGPGDHLLVHDDLMGDRKVAFIYYMAPWDLMADKVDDATNDSEGKSSTPQESTECDADGLAKDSCEDVDSSKETKDEVTSDLVDSLNVPKDEFKINNSLKETNSENFILNSGSANGWKKNMGGALEFLTTDSKGLPTVTVKSLLPSNNTFAFFKVGSNTFHQVSEVLSFDFPRVTINGWFHGPQDEGEPIPKHIEDVTSVPYKDLKEKPHLDMYQATMNQWITSTYLSPRTKFKIQQQIESSSEISLEEFLVQKQYNLVVKSLQNSDLIWEPYGPAHLRRYDLLSETNADEPLKEVLQLFSSNHFVRLLGEFTDLRFTSYHTLQVQRWTAASYTVIPPKSHAQITELDVTMYLGLPDKRFNGGSTIYLAPEEANSEPLITIEPCNNCLNLVYSDAGTTKFTKYVSKLGFNKTDYFYLISCTYRE